MSDMCEVRGCSRLGWRRRGDAAVVDTTCGIADGKQHLHKIPKGAWAHFCLPGGGRLPVMGFICSRHFLPSDYVKKKDGRTRPKPRLLPTAQPTQNPPESFRARSCTPPKMSRKQLSTIEYNPRSSKRFLPRLLMSLPVANEGAMDPAQRAELVQQAMEEYEKNNQTESTDPGGDRQHKRRCGAARKSSSVSKTQPGGRKSSFSPPAPDTSAENEPGQNGHWLAELLAESTEPRSTSTDIPRTPKLSGSGTLPKLTKAPHLTHQKIIPNSAMEIVPEQHELDDDSSMDSDILMDSSSDIQENDASCPSVEGDPSEAVDPMDPAQAAPADSLVTMWPFVQVVQQTPPPTSEKYSEPERCSPIPTAVSKRIITVVPTRRNSRAGSSQVRFVTKPSTPPLVSATKHANKVVTLQRPPPSVQDKVVKDLQKELDHLRAQLVESNRQIAKWRKVLSREASVVSATPTTSPYDPLTLNRDDYQISSSESDDDNKSSSLPPESVTLTYPINQLPMLPVDRSAAESAYRLAVRNCARLHVSSVKEKLALRRTQLRLLEQRLKTRLSRQKRVRRLSALLTPTQLAALDGNAPAHWPAEDYRRAVQLRSACGTAGYKWLQRNWRLPLPPLATLPVPVVVAGSQTGQKCSQNGVEEEKSVEVREEFPT